MYHPNPRITPENADYFAACGEGRLTGSRCRACGSVHCPPAKLCGCSLGAEAEVIELSGRGTIYSFSELHRPAGPRFGDDVPYVLALVALEEGPRMITNIVDADADIAIGQDVAVRFEPCEDPALHVPVFTPIARTGR